MSATCEYIAVTDPQAGFITGGGRINSAPGSSAKDAPATGKASYGFAARYAKETGLPTGDVDFDFAAGSLSLEVDLSGKQPGIYLLHIRIGANREVMKLVKP